LIELVFRHFQILSVCGACDACGQLNRSFVVLAFDLIEKL
jgi:hypothetical protein